VKTTGEWRYSPPFLTSAPEVYVQYHVPPALTPVPTRQDIGWAASGPWGGNKSLARAGNQTPAMQPVDIPTELSAAKLSAIISYVPVEKCYSVYEMFEINADAN
jgi:hypothetical protein